MRHDMGSVAAEPDRDDPPRTRPAGLGRALVRWAVVALLLAGSALGAVVADGAVGSRQQARFDTQVERLDVALAERMRAYVQVLRGGAGLFASSDAVTRADWDTYVSSLRLEERYPGIKSLSYAPAVAAADLDAFVREVRTEPVPPTLGPPDALRGYALRAPDGSTGVPPVHSPILFVAPFDERNRQVLGVDMMLEPRRREVMTRAALTGEAVVSPRLRLSGSADDEAGFIVYVPIQRAGEFLGWLTAAFVAETFTEGLDEARGTDLAFELYDARGTSAENRLFSTAGVLDDGAPRPLQTDDGPFSTLSRVDVPGARWSVRYVAPEGFVPASSRAVPWLVLLLGLLATASLVALGRGAERWRGQALRLSEQAEVLTRARADAERATRATSTFLATMSHEIRTPLNAVLGVNRVLLETPLDPEQREYATVIGDSGSHLLRVINEILDYSKIEAGRVELDRERLDVAACVHSVVTLMGPVAEEAGVRLTSEVAGDPWVWGDGGRLRQVLLNLVSNALKFTPAGGQVVLRARTGDGRAAFSVADTGIGMSAEQVERVFEPFVQAHASVARTYGGTGLGLSIAERIVTAMGGRITVESEVGVGTTFRFDVVAEPAGAAAPARVDRPWQDLAERHPLRVLVADDDDVNRMLVERMLLAMGYAPDLVGDGAAAVEAVRARPYDVVLLDLQMPVLDGRAAAEAIVVLRGDDEHPRLVAMTGSAGEAERRSAAAAGFVDFVIKPFDPEDLAAALARTPLRGVADGSLR